MIKNTRIAELSKKEATLVCGMGWRDEISKAAEKTGEFVAKTEDDVRKVLADNKETVKEAGSEFRASYNDKKDKLHNDL
jgi:gas vesicle protein